MTSKEVQGRCGPDGRLTRLHAYTQWFNKLKQFENHCAAEGGTFAYEDPNFAEPQDESFCLQAVPEGPRQAVVRVIDDGAAGGPRVLATAIVTVAPR